MNRVPAELRGQLEGAAVVREVPAEDVSKTDNASEQASFVDELPNDLLSTRSARSRSPPRGESGVTTAISNSETNTALDMSPARRRAWDNEHDDVKTARVCQSEENLLASVGTFKC
uniref:Uncharacterized protein n=1 Tax=Meloidogyne javanica TaxID=6303 RepID=A0A915M254_MELJA